MEIEYLRQFDTEEKKIMKKMEQIELDAHRRQIVGDMQSLVEKYRTIFGWDIPEIDQNAADKLILAAIHKALDDIEKALQGTEDPGK